MTLAPDAPGRLWTDVELSRLNERFRGCQPEALLGWAAERFGTTAALTCSFGGPAGMVLLDLVVQHRLPLSVIFLDTDLLFPETYALVEATERHYGITIKRQRPALSLEEQARAYGPELYARNPDRCCAMRKVAPLAEALQPYQVWISGIRREQTTQRAATEPVAWNKKYGVLKLSPLAHWVEREVWAYLSAHNVPYNPLLDQGYPSLGCIPCTRPASTNDPRDGRWNGFAKTECGLHT